jgi:alpha-galactosidase/6-phospho-beta-glucosidase family protein
MATKKKQNEQEQETAEVVTAAPAFTKKQILKSRTYARYIDLLNALLNDNKSYSHADIEQIIKNAYSGKYQLK